MKQLRPFGKLRLEIVRRCDQTKGFKVLPKRWIVERTFGWLYKSRRLCRDYEVRLDHSEAMIRICMIRLMLKRLARFGPGTGGGKAATLGMESEATNRIDGRFTYDS